MLRELQLLLSPEEAEHQEFQEKAIRQKLGLSPNDALTFRLLRRSIDARKKKVKVQLKVLAAVDEGLPNLDAKPFMAQNVTNAAEVHIIGCGPAGMFAAMRLIELGLKPVLLERGKDVRARRRDIAAINKEHVVNPHSNYCFGEGGAGTFSDGKLYTRSTKRGNVQRVLDWLHEFGSPAAILVDAHPHIGTNKLPKVVANMREQILACGGEIHFDTWVEGFVVEHRKLTGLQVQGATLAVEQVLLATGHSARDIYQYLSKQKIKIEAKPFALGVRVEHPQQTIDQIQYNCDVRGDYLPAASYALVHQTMWKKQQRGVFSFCMCPGGFIVPAATSPGEIVVNGMSPSKRNSAFANSGIVVAIELNDVAQYAKHGPLAAMEFQAEIERAAAKVSDGKQSAPAQRMVDFVEGRVSQSLNSCSYIPGLVSANLRDVLPEGVSYRLQEAFKAFGKKMKGYFTNEANVVGVESRSSAPVRIPRNRETLEHEEVAGLFPCGEGAGYAGGIVSAALDGIRCAEAMALKHKG